MHKSEVSELKDRRQKAMADLIREHVLANQEEVAARLSALGFEVTQATVSRDITELGLMKAPRGGSHVYVAPEDAAPAPPPASDERLRRILADVPVTVGRSGLTLVLNGTPGTASVVAQAIDESTLQEQEGTLAGDNTLLVLFADEDRLERWLARFRHIQSLPGAPAGPAIPEEHA